MSKFFVACNYVSSYSQITAASDWPHPFCTLSVLKCIKDIATNNICQIVTLGDASVPRTM